MHGDTQRAKIANAEHAADDIPAEVVKYEDLPKGIAIGGYDGAGGTKCAAVGLGSFGFILIDVVVQAEELLERRYDTIRISIQLTKKSVREWACDIQIWRSRSEWPFAAMAMVMVGVASQL